MELDQLYDPPSEAIQRGVLPHLVAFHRDYLAAARFFCFATGRPQSLDVSPRGGPPGFVRALDDHTVAFGDFPGNNRIESMRNVAADPRAAMLFIFPGLEIFMRINGRARVVTDDALRESLEEAGKRPKTAIVLAIDEVLFHCGKAINRAHLWDASAHLDRAALPTPGKMKAAMTNGTADDARALDAAYTDAVRTELY